MSRAALAAKAETAAVQRFPVGEDPFKLGLLESLVRLGGKSDRRRFFSIPIVTQQDGLLRDMIPGRFLTRSPPKQKEGGCSRPRTLKKMRR